MRSWDDIAPDVVFHCCSLFCLIGSCCGPICSSLRHCCLIGWNCASAARSAVCPKLQVSIVVLEGKYKRLVNQDAEIRSALRRISIYKRKVDNKVLAWLDDADELENRLRTSLELINNNTCFYNYFRHQNLINQLIREADDLQNIGSSLQLVAKLTYSSSVVPPAARTLIGMSAQNVSDEIWECLMDPTIDTIGIYGLGGVGKTTIMMNIRNQLLEAEIFDKIIWVTLSESWSLERAQLDIAQQLGITLLDPVYKRTHQLYLELMKVKKYLFILDDMWTTIDLYSLGIHQEFRLTNTPMKDGCKIVVTTRSRDICRWMRADKVICLGALSETEAWNLFVNKSGDPFLPPHIQIMAKKIASECGGLPIAINTVAYAMRETVDFIAWRKALEDLQSAKEIHQGKDEVFILLKFGYTHLKNYTVRKCFAYCGFFPEDYKFESNELIGYWMAENFIDSKGGIIASLDEGLEIVRELKNANMLEVFSEGSNEWLIMHDLFRDLASRILQEEFGFCARTGLGVVQVHPRYWEDWEVITATKLSTIRNEIQVLDGTPFCSDLSTWLLKDNPLSHISPSFFNHMINLQVLDMSYSGITEVPPSVCKLAKLRALFLQYCTSLKIIPSLEKLKELKVLNLSGTLIKELPEGTKGLVSLTSLDISETTRLEKIHVGVILALSNLQELHMQGSRLCKMELPMVADCFKEIRHLKKLAILTLSAVGFEDHLDTILHLQGQSLKRFSINVYGSSSDYMDDVEYI